MRTPIYSLLFFSIAVVFLFTCFSPKNFAATLGAQPTAYTEPELDSVKQILDLDNDNKVGLSDAIHALQVAADGGGGLAYAIHALQVVAGSGMGEHCFDEDNDGSTTCDGDCDDNDQRVFPSQLEYYTTPRINGNYDFNCDGVETLQYPNVGACGPLSNCGAITPGWSVGGSQIPPCGEEAWWFFHCVLEPMGTPHCSETMPINKRTQGCR